MYQILAEVSTMAYIRYPFLFCLRFLSLATLGLQLVWACRGCPCPDHLDVQLLIFSLPGFLWPSHGRKVCGGNHKPGEREWKACGLALMDVPVKNGS